MLVRRRASRVRIILRAERLKIAHLPLPQIIRLLPFAILQLNPVDPATFVVPIFGLRLVAGVLVVPVDEVDVAVGAPLQIDRSKVLVPALQEVVAAAGDVAAPAGLQDVLLQTATVDATEDHTVAEPLRHVRHVETQQARVGPAGFFVESVIRDFLDVAVAVRVVRGARLALVNPARHHVVQVRDDAARQNDLPVGVAPIHAPRVARALAENLELLRLRVQAPHGGVHPRFGAVERLHGALREDAMQSVEPAVGAPGEGVERLVRVALVVPAIEEDLRLPGGLRLIPVAHGDEHQMRSRADPNAAEADFNAADEVQFLHEDRALVELAVAVGVLKDQDAILAFTLEGALRIVHALDDPEPSTVIQAEGDGLHHVGFAGKERRLEAGRQGHFFGGLRAGQAGELHIVGGLRGRGGFGIGGPEGNDAEEKNGKEVA